ncbi:hypothetical protein HK098_006463 [Nowakowskiella sp. JEL0407]|nr:hypothetical protein HK098_006463 [Nowakowskiella sp. JEL0407]
MIELSRNVDFFVKFVNLLMNDTTYLLDESLAKLTEIRNIQNEMESPGWNTATQQHRQEREGLLRTSERQATSYMSLGVETVHMLKYLTAEERIVEPFMQAYIVERLAAMLDFNLAAMVGPRCTELKVKNPEKYRFNPKSLLNELIDIFMHLAHRQEFIVAVAKDGRSYKKEHFYKSCEILLRVGLKREDECERIRQFVQSVENAIAAENEEEEELGEIPDEFLDPLMYTLMEDPVILPTSRVTMDRSTIKSHLLSDQRDPINRMPLTIDMVVDNVELKQKIAEWRRDKKKNGVAPMEM